MLTSRPMCSTCTCTCTSSLQALEGYAITSVLILEYRHSTRKSMVASPYVHEKQEMSYIHTCNVTDRPFAVCKFPRPQALHGSD